MHVYYVTNPYQSLTVSEESVTPFVLTLLIFTGAVSNTTEAAQSMIRWDAWTKQITIV